MMLPSHSFSTCCITLICTISIISTDSSAFSRHERRRHRRNWGTGPPQTPGATCTFDPCSVPNFCSGGRECQLDDSCNYKCLCTDESTHESCISKTTVSPTPKQDDNVTEETPDTTTSKNVTVEKPETTTSKIICTFNPCTVPNFCGDGMRCEIDQKCRHTCVCLDGSTHEKCTQVTIPPHLTTTTAITCTFNPCSMPNNHFCGEGRRCDIDTKTCIHQCVCLDNTTHEICRTDVTPTTETPDDDIGRNCPTSFPCKHGYCEFPAIKCICDEGWGGDFCDKEAAQCTKECKEGTKCLLLPDFSQVCVRTQPGISTAAPSEADWTNVCSDYYRPRNESEKMCKYGMRCYYGICVDMDDQRSRCECDPGALGTLCTKKCCRDCGPNGDCFLDDNRNELCNCHYNYTGPNCSVLKPTVGPPEKETWYLWVVGSCAVLMLLLLILLVAVPYVMWKHRVILVMKIVHYFQNYEENDDREWDVFISYKATGRDESFVVQTLYPKLEQELGFKLNMHFRDFIPGDTIANNIIRAVQGSRRTILLISPSFVRSEFTRFEYQVAQQEMLKRKHRIIPVLLDDISDCQSSMDPNLKTILSSVTYLEWPGDSCPDKKVDKFWKRLQLSLPKKRSNSDTSKTSSSGNIAFDDIRLSDVSKKDSFSNGISHSNQFWYSEPDVDYDTINEADLDICRTMKNDIENTTDSRTNVGGQIKS